MYLSLYFPSVSPPKYRKFSKCKHFGERRTATRFGNTLHVEYSIIYIVDAIKKYNKRKNVYENRDYYVILYIQSS